MTMLRSILATAIGAFTENSTVEEARQRTDRMLRTKPAPMTATDYERQEMRERWEAKQMDLGEAMARSAGWKTATMKPVEVHKYKTPTQSNPDCMWSLGIMNLTEAEANVIGQFARGIRSVNSPRAQGLTATEMRERSNLVDGSGKRCGAQCTSPKKCYAQNFCDIRWRESSARANGGETERQRGASAFDNATKEMRAAYDQWRASPNSLTAKERYEAARTRVLQEAATDPKTAKQLLTGDWSEPTSEPELEMPGNRFSGLDIPDADDKP